MFRIVEIKALEILDSRGYPTLEVSVTTDNGIIGTSSIPSGASKGENEALELRDNDPNRYFGKGVKKAVQNVLGPLTQLLLNQNVIDQVKIDRLMIEADGTPNKSRLGANAILGLSIACTKAAAKCLKLPLYHYIAGCQPSVYSHKSVNEFVADCAETTLLLPCPMMNIINGGMHADNQIPFQEFMIRPLGAATFSEALRFGAEIFHTLKILLKEKGFNTSVGDEGGFAPHLNSNEQALDFILQAIEKAGFRQKKDISIALDCAASTFYKNGTYLGKSPSEHVDDLAKLVTNYPIDSIEDGMSEEDWAGWKILTARLGSQIQLVGDDIFVTNTKFLSKGIKEKVGNAILIKPNQIGTLTETIECINLAKEHGLATIISHRSGETEDTFIADLSVALATHQIKTGSLCRQERIAKYNRLLEIESELGKQARFAGKYLK